MKHKPIRTDWKQRATKAERAISKALVNFGTPEDADGFDRIEALLQISQTAADRIKELHKSVENANIGWSSAKRDLESSNAERALLWKLVKKLMQ